MESTLYEDFPLFGGDLLLDGFSLLAEPVSDKLDVNTASLAPLSPGVGSDKADDIQSWIIPAKSEQDIGQASQSEWLDTKLDLLEFLDDLKSKDAPKASEPEDAITVLDGLHKAPALQHSISNATLMEALTSLTDALDVPITVEQVYLPTSDTDTEEYSTPLSPVSVDDLDSLLSDSIPSTSNTAPASPRSEHDVEAFNTILLDLMSQEPDAVGPVKKSKSRRKTPYGSTKKDYDKSLDRKERKKQQNKDAALRYRSKKRGQHDVLNDEAEELEEKNKILREKVDSIAREIQYLKDLMAEVNIAKKTG